MSVPVADPETGMDLRDLLSDPDFPNRRKSARQANAESIALRKLARVFAERPEAVLQELVNIAVESCGADSAGISLEETGQSGQAQFRWIVVAGSFERYLNGTTPRNYSPCGTCLDCGRPQLYRLKNPYYDFLGVEAKPIVDGILIPWLSEKRKGTLWAVSHSQDEAFDLEDYSLLNSLADFAAIAIRHQDQQQVLREKEQKEASAARAHAMAHQINNPLQSLTNTIYLAQQGGPDAGTYVDQAARDLAELSALVQKLLNANA